MQALGSRVCPKCHVRSKFKHCKSPTCTWLVCFHCVTSGRILVFSPRTNLYFVDLDGGTHKSENI